jgi:hypothetical protein
MVQLRGDGDLAQKPFGAEGGGELGAEDFDRDFAVVLHIVGEEDERHPAPAKLPIDCVAAREGGSKTPDEVSQ